MKFETKLKRALEKKDLQVRYLALVNLGFECFPGSANQKIVIAEIHKTYELLKMEVNNG